MQQKKRRVKRRSRHFITSPSSKKGSRRQRHPGTRELRVRTRGERRYFAFAPRYSDHIGVASSSELDPRDACSLLRPQPRVASISPLRDLATPFSCWSPSDVLNAAAPVSRPAGHPRFGSIDMGAGGDSKDTVDANGDGHVNITKGARPGAQSTPSARLPLHYMTNTPPCA